MYICLWVSVSVHECKMQFLRVMTYISPKKLATSGVVTLVALPYPLLQTFLPKEVVNTFLSFPFPQLLSLYCKSVGHQGYGHYNQTGAQWKVRVALALMSFIAKLRKLFTMYRVNKYFLLEKANKGPMIDK